MNRTVKIYLPSLFVWLVGFAFIGYILGVYVGGLAL